MRTLRLDADGDLDLTYGRATFVSGGEAAAQRMRQRFETVRGEWAYDRRRGIPLYDEIVGKGPLVLATHAWVVTTARQTPGITAVERIVIDLLPTRQLTVEVDARASDEPVSVQTVLGG